MTHYMKVDIEHPQTEPTEDTEVICDVYDTEIREGDKYFINEFGELIHEVNMIRYCVEENIVNEYTR